MEAHFEPVMSDWEHHHQQGGLPVVGIQESLLRHAGLASVTFLVITIFVYLLVELLI